MHACARVWCTRVRILHHQATYTVLSISISTAATLGVSRDVLEAYSRPRSIGAIIRQYLYYIPHSIKYYKNTQILFYNVQTIYIHMIYAYNQYLQISRKIHIFIYLIYFNILNIIFTEIIQNIFILFYIILST